MRHPPENSFSVRSCAGAVNPSPARIVPALAGASWAPMSVRRSWISEILAGSVAVSASSRSRDRSRSAASTNSTSVRVIPRRFLGNGSDTSAPWNGHRSLVRTNLAKDQLKQGGFARAIAADKADLVAGRNRSRCLIEQEAPFDPVAEIVDVQHGLPLSGRRNSTRRRSIECLGPQS